MGDSLDADADVDRDEAGAMIEAVALFDVALAAVLGVYMLGVRAGRRDMADEQEVTRRRLAEGYLRERRLRRVLEDRVRSMDSPDRRSDTEFGGARW